MALSNRAFVLALVVVAAALVGHASAATYVVGDAQGWKVPNTPADYANWASRHQFAIGDVLVFNFMSGQHDVAQVTKASYDGCSSNNPLLLVTVGPSNITLRSAGQSYYICTFGSHCSLGQKFAINVSASSATTPSPAPAPTTPITPTPTPTPSPSGSPSPSPMVSPGSAPAPSPSGGASPPGSAASPGAEGPSGPQTPGFLSPPSPPATPPSSATASAASALLLGLALVAMVMVV